jgi:hypothetical protein
MPWSPIFVHACLQEVFFESSPSDHETWSIRCHVGIHVDLTSTLQTWTGSDFSTNERARNRNGHTGSWSRVCELGQPLIGWDRTPKLVAAQLHHTQLKIQPRNFRCERTYILHACNRWARECMGLLPDRLPKCCVRLIITGDSWGARTGKYLTKAREGRGRQRKARQGKVVRRRLRIAGRLFHQVLPDLALVYCEGRSDWNLLYIVRVPSHYPWHWPVLCHRFSYMAKYRSPSPVAFGTDYEEGLASYKEEAAAAAQEVRSKFASPPPLASKPTNQ